VRVINFRIIIIIIQTRCIAIYNLLHPHVHTALHISTLTIHSYLHISFRGVTSRNRNKCSAVAEMGDRLTAIDMGRKLGAVLLLGGGAQSPCNTMRPGSRPTFVPSGILIHPYLATTNMGRKMRGLCPLLGRGAGSPCNTMSLG